MFHIFQVIATTGMRQKKSFLHNLKLALVESVDFDSQNKNLVSVKQALVKFFLF